MSRKYQHGQATIELTVMLFAVMAVILGIVMLNGYFMTNHKVLLEARYKAQQQAANGISENGGGSEIVSWSYPRLDLRKRYVEESSRRGRQTESKEKNETEKNLTRDYKIFWEKEQMEKGVFIPFALNGSPQYAGEADVTATEYSGNLIGSAKELLDRETDSHYEGEWEKYGNWRNGTDFDAGFSHDFVSGLNAQNALSAAALAEGRAGNVEYSSALEKMFRGFRALFGLRSRKLDLESNPGNRVYMPHTGKD